MVLRSSQIVQTPRTIKLKLFRGSMIISKKQEKLNLSFNLRKSLFKAHVRRNIPWPIQIKLKKPIFVIGSSRSGTTMLSSILAAIPEICDFTEKPIVRHQMWRMVENPATISNELPQLEKTLVRLSGIKSEQRLIEKTPGHSLIADSLSSYFSDASFIHILRDGRDVASSMLGHRWISRELKGEVDIFWFHLLPKDYQDKWSYLDLWERGVLRWATYVTFAKKANLDPKRYLEISYEKICNTPKESIYKLLNFLELRHNLECDKKISTIQSDRVGGWRSNNFTQEQKNFYQQVLVDFDLLTLNIV